ncbi:MAG: type II toxin-antitoxin system HicB family antitoxin [Planctomycetaceae bacterium]
MMEYKGYIGKVEFDDEAAIFQGVVINTCDVITFQGESVSKLTQAFHDSVDDYLAFCMERGAAPDKPFSGQFLTRIPPELHRQVNVAAVVSGKSLNSWVAEQLQAAVQRPGAIKAAGKKATNSTKAVKKTTSRKKNSPQHA